MKKMLIGIAVACLVIVVAVVSFFETTLSPYNRAKNEAIELVVGDGLMTKVDKFYLYQWQKTIYGLYGDNAERKKVYILIDVDTKTAQLYQADELIDEKAVLAYAEKEEKQLDVLYITLGLLDDKPVWEVTYKTDKVPLGYITISAKTGEIIKHIKTV